MAKFPLNFDDLLDFTLQTLGKQCISGADGAWSIPQPRPAEPVEVRNLGLLDLLPQELQHQVLKALDLKTLLNFRRTNKHANALVYSMTEWRKVRLASRAIHCPWSIRAEIRGKEESDMRPS